MSMYRLTSWRPRTRSSSTTPTKRPPSIPPPTPPPAPHQPSRDGHSLVSVATRPGRQEQPCKKSPSPPLGRENEYAERRPDPPTASRQSGGAGSDQGASEPCSIGGFDASLGELESGRTARDQ